MSDTETKTEVKAEATSHTFSNGQTLNFSARQKMKKDVTVNEDGSVKVDFMFADGTEQTMEMKPDHELFSTLAGYGISQKVGDSAASTKDVADAFINIQRTIAQLNDGKWSVRKPASGAGQLTLLVEAVMRLKGVDQAAAASAISAMSDEQLAQTNALQVVKNTIAEIKLERMQAKIEENKAKADAEGDDGSATLDSLI